MPALLHHHASHRPACFIRLTALAARVLAGLLPLPVVANEATPWQRLAGDRLVLLMRHTPAPGTGDPAAFRLDDCATQPRRTQPPASTR